MTISMKPLLTLGLVLGLSIPPLSASQDATLGLLVRTLAGIENPETQANILRGMNASLKGKQGVTAPEEWEALFPKLQQSPDEEVRRQALALAAALGGKGALDSLRQTLADAAATRAERESALGSLLAAKDQATLPLLLELITRPGPLRAAALRGLAGYDDPAIPPAVVAGFPELETSERPDALNTLVGRTAGAAALIAAIDAGQIPQTEVSAPLAAQLRGLRDPQIDAWVEKNWGSVRSSSADKQQEIEQHKKFLGTEAILAADPRKGREHFLQRCAACHVLHGEGQKIGPELPGSYKDLDYLLQNILDPNAVIGKDYQQTLVRTKDGQILSGVIAGEEETAVTLKTLVGSSTIQRKDIESIETLEHSLMPEGLLTGLQEDDIRDLFLYLRLSEPLPNP
jgi:putative heme-binding domain-containing protein